MIGIHTVRSRMVDDVVIPIELVNIGTGVCARRGKKRRKSQNKIRRYILNRVRNGQAMLPESGDMLIVR